MKEYSVVKVVRLIVPTRRVDGNEGVTRQPKVGDVGTIVHDAGNIFIVECVNSDGYTLWLADFEKDELEEA